MPLGCAPGRRATGASGQARVPRRARGHAERGHHAALGSLLMMSSKRNPGSQWHRAAFCAALRRKMRRSRVLAASRISVSGLTRRVARQHAWRTFKLRGRGPAPWHPAAGPLIRSAAQERRARCLDRGQPFDPCARSNACAARCPWISFIPYSRAASRRNATMAVALLAAGAAQATPGARSHWPRRPVSSRRRCCRDAP